MSSYDQYDGMPPTPRHAAPRISQRAREGRASAGLPAGPSSVAACVLSSLEPTDRADHERMLQNLHPFTYPAGTTSSTASVYTWGASVAARARNQPRAVIRTRWTTSASRTRCEASFTCTSAHKPDASVLRLQHHDAPNVRSVHAYMELRRRRRWVRQTSQSLSRKFTLRPPAQARLQLRQRRGLAHASGSVHGHYSLCARQRAGRSEV